MKIRQAVNTGLRRSIRGKKRKLAMKLKEAGQGGNISQIRSPLFIPDSTPPKYNRRLYAFLKSVFTRLNLYGYEILPASCDIRLSEYWAIRFAVRCSKQDADAVMTCQNKERFFTFAKTCLLMQRSKSGWQPLEFIAICENHGNNLLANFRMDWRDFINDMDEKRRAEIRKKSREIWHEAGQITRGL